MPSLGNVPPQPWHKHPLVPAIINLYILSEKHELFRDQLDTIKIYRKVYKFGIPIAIAILFLVNY